MSPSPRPSSVVVVGPCASGKSTLVRGLLSHKIEARVCAQEHSAIPTLWRHQGRPILIGLAVGLETIRIRRQPRWSKALYEAQLERLSDAYANADLLIETDELSSRVVLEEALRFLAGSTAISWEGSSPLDERKATSWRPPAPG